MSFRIIKRAAKYCGRQTFRSLPSRARKFIHSASADEPSKECEQAAAAFKELIDRSISAANSRDFDAAERCLREAAMLDPSNPEIAPHLGRVRFLRSRDGEPGRAAQTQSMLATIGSIRREIESKSLYVPSRYWEKHGAFHTALLERYGIENFKRTVSHDYQNWFMTDLHDPQVRQLFNKWPDHFAKEPWFNVMEVPDNVGYHLSMNFEKPTNPLASLSQRELYRICVGLLWEYVARTDAANVLARLTESEIGNPYRIWRKGQLISSDLAHSVRERNMLLGDLSLDGTEGLVVGELGAGHGRLTEVFGLTTNYRYFIFDVTPALFVSQWYIKALFPGEKVFEFRHFENFDDIRDELQKSRFAFFTANQIENLPRESLDLFVNMNSLGEMRIEQINNFLHYIDQLTKFAFFSRQYVHWTNPADHVTVTKKTFAMPEHWQLGLNKIDDIHPNFFNQIWRKRALGAVGATR